jgi:RNA polymerase sigma factor (sigma-70 family)
MNHVLHALLAQPDVYLRLKKMCRKITKGGIETTEDILHDTLVQALSSTTQYTHIDETHFFSWMRKIARRKFFDTLRRPRHSKIHVPFTEMVTTKNVVSSQEELQLAKEALCFIEQQTALQKNIFLLLILEYRYDEIAKKLDIPIGTVSGSVARVRAKFQAFESRQKAPT